MIIELRTYHCAPGRLADLHHRLGKVVPPFFQKYGIETVGFWTTLVGSSSQRVTYMVKWDSLSEREKKWTAFQSDSEWILHREEGDKNGPLVLRAENELLSPTAYSALR